VYLIDYNTYRFVHPKSLMYATTFCIEKRSQANDFFLARMSEYRLLTEFRSALKDFVEEHGSFFTAKVVKVTVKDLVILELYHEKFTEPISDVLKVMTIQKFLPEELPALGDVRGRAFVIHAEEDGTVFFQFFSYEFDLYRRELNSISVESYQDALTKGPYKIDETKKNLIYLTQFHDDYCYRVQILKFPSNAEDDTVEVEFIDFGNTDTVNKSSLVPCEVLNKYLPHFPRQAIKARLINIEHMDMRCFRRLINEDVAVGVETLKCANEEGCALVEMVVFKDDEGKFFHVSQYLREDKKKKKFFQTWSEPLMKGMTKDHVTFHSLETINMKGAIWRDQYGKEVELGFGVMVDVCIAQTNTPGDFTIQPFGVQPDLKKIETDLHIWYKKWSCGNDPEAYQDVRRDCMFSSLYLKDLDRRVRIRLVENPFIPGAEYVRVLLLDYGRYLKVFKPTLCSISIDACKAGPAMGARGILKRVADPRYKRKKWSPEECQAFSARVRGKRFMYKISGFEYDENGCLKLTGDLYERSSTSTPTPTKSESAKPISQSGKTPEGLRKLRMRELTHIDPKPPATATKPGIVSEPQRTLKSGRI